MSVTQPAQSPFDHDRYFTFTVNDETYNGSIHFHTHYTEKPDFVEVLRNSFFRNGTLNDTRADWHRNTTSFHAWVKAHMLRLAWDCRETHLRHFLKAFPAVCRDFGFPVEHNRDMSGAPSQSRLWEMWNDEFTDVQREFVRAATEEALAFAREQGIPAPDPVFQPPERDITSNQSKQRLVTEKTKDVWQQAKPFVTDTFYLKRADNSVIHENAFWEQHTYMGMRENMYAQSGQHSFSIDSQRDRTPSASNHRYQIGKLTVKETRSMLHETTQILISRAHHNAELVGKLWAAIDITKGNPWTGKIERDEDDNISEDWILGYKDGEVYYQWATIQIVGYDIPLVLDAIPVKRGMKRADIVDSLLENALDLVDDIELVMMDREFDSTGVKNACDKHSVYYLNGARKHQSERATCTRLRRSGETVHIEEETVVDGPPRKQMYLPTSVSNDFEMKDEDEGRETEERSDIHEQMRDDLNDLGIELDGDDSQHAFSSLTKEIQEEEANKPTVGSKEDAQEYALFETNHPSVTLDDNDSEIERIHMVERMVRRYRHRWGIENGYKQIKTFRVRTTSKRHTYRFFNFVFACVLYNVWRLVDLLVKLAIDDENATYGPCVDANQFLTVAKEYYGLDPPD